MTLRAAFGLAVFAITLVRHSSAQDNATLEVGGGRIEVNFASPPAPELRKLVLAGSTPQRARSPVTTRNFP